MRWEIGPGVRCDLITYGGLNLSGRRQVMQMFPTGARKGRIDGTDLRSLVIRALPGTRVVLAASDKDSWQLASWRCIRMLEGSSLRSDTKNGLPGIRVPDIEMFDHHGAKRTDPELQSSYPAVDSLEAGEGWTFGRPGNLANRVAMIRVDREGVGAAPVLGAPELVAQGILASLRHSHPDALPAALEAACKQLARVLEGPDASLRIEHLRAEFE